jgi:hypothetical protein
MGQDMQREMRPLGDADAGADHRQPGLRVFADLLDEEEIERVTIEPELTPRSNERLPVSFDRSSGPGKGRLRGKSGSRRQA